MALKTQQELYEEYINEIQSQRPDLTDLNEGSLIDLNAGITAAAVSELSRIFLDEVRKTFFDQANGPEVTGGPDDLQTLALDHFGETFKRPGATKAIGTVALSRPSAGDPVSILAGTIVKTKTNAAGKSQRYKTTTDVTLTATTVSVAVEAVVAGTDGNVLPSTVVEIETSLTDPDVTVTNALAFAGGANAQTDVEYRLFIKRLIETLAGASIGAIKSKALTIPGVVSATPQEFIQIVREWDNALGVPIGTYFKIPRVKLYIADLNGTASQALIDAVNSALDGIRAAGVRIEVLTAVAIVFNWSAQITLNPTGPNFATLQSDPSLITDDMIKYVQDLAIGTGFTKATAEAYILDRWGPTGTNDLTAFVTTIPAGNVAVTANQKLIPGTMEIV